MDPTERISNAELEVMKLLWQGDKPLSFGEIRLALGKARGWEKSTVNTLVHRLVGKGAVCVQQGPPARYAPALTYAQYAQAEERRFIDKLYGGSAKALVTGLCQRGQLSEADIDELKAFFQMGGGKT